MKEILRIDLHNYQDTWPTHKRLAAKAIFSIEDKLVMLQSKLGDVKFVGGGIEEGESPKDCLIREVREETGYEVITSSIKEIGIVIERRKDKYAEAICINEEALHKDKYNAWLYRDLSLLKLLYHKQ